MRPRRFIMEVKKETVEEVLIDIEVELMKMNTVNAMRLLHEQNKTKYSDKEMEWLAAVVDADELCSGGNDPDDSDDDDLLHEVKN